MGQRAGMEMASAPRRGIATLQRRIKQVGRALRRNPTMAFGFFILGLTSIIAIFSPQVTKFDPQELDPLNRLQAPSAQHYFGTDQSGRDVYTRTIYGSRISLLLGASVASITMIGGAVLGLITGYYKALDKTIMRVMDALMSFPSLLLAISLVAILGANVINVIVSLSIVDTPRTVRVVRSSVLSLREREFIEAARAIGASPFRILARHVFPNLVAPLLVMGSFIFALAILAEAGLSFLGTGVPLEIPSWGNMVGGGRFYARQAFWIIFFPGLFLSFTVLGVNLIGDGLRDSLDPRISRRM